MLSNLVADFNMKPNTHGVFKKNDKPWVYFLISKR